MLVNLRLRGTPAQEKEGYGKYLTFFETSNMTDNRGQKSMTEDMMKTTEGM